MMPVRTAVDRNNLWFDGPSCSEKIRSSQSCSWSSQSAGLISPPSSMMKPKVVKLKPRRASIGDEGGIQSSDSQGQSLVESLVWSGPGNRVCLAPLPEKLESQNPYIGYFHRGHKANYHDIPDTMAGDLAQPMKRRKRLGKSCSSEDLERLERQLSSERISCNVSLEDCEEVELEEQEHRCMMKKALQLQNNIPQSPELCAIQAMLPRQSGVRVLEKIGEGSFGKVVLANNERNKSQWDKKFLSTRHLFDMPAEGENLVLKCVKKEPFGAAGAAFEGELVHREVRLHARCKHPNIVKIYGFYEQEEQMTLILGFAQGRELHTILQEKRRYGEADALPIFLQVLRAVDFMHGMNIVHRDLKPRNILVSNSGKATVLDLGLALDLSDPKDRESCENQELVGTLGYLPPELYLDKITGLPMDVWAVGVVLYEMLFGFSPFLPHEISLPSPVEFPDESWGMIISDMTKDLLLQLLHKDTTQRITAGSVLQHPIWTAGMVSSVDSLIAREAVPTTIVERRRSCRSITSDPDHGEESEFSENFAIRVNKDMVGSLEWGGQYFYEYYCAIVADAGSEGSDPEF